jgi:hypothetical protein
VDRFRSDFCTSVIAASPDWPPIELVRCGHEVAANPLWRDMQYF